MMGISGIWQWVIVLIIILLIFGTKHLRSLGSDLGSAIKGFRKGVADGDKEAKAADAPVEKAAEEEKQDGGKADG